MISVGTVWSTLLSIGFIGALINYFLRGLSSSRQRRRERNGILRLINSEVERNRLQLRSFEANPTWIAEAPEHVLSGSVWEEARAKLSGLLRDEVLFADLDKYYTNVMQINLYRLRNDIDKSVRIERTLELLELMKELTCVVGDGISGQKTKLSQGTQLQAVEGKEETP